MSFDYNTTRPKMILPEYGRNVQKLVEYVKNIEDRDQRTHYAKILVELMRQVNPSIKDPNEYNQKLWDDLFILSGYDLEVDSPFPMPEKELLGKKPKPLKYSRGPLRFKHYGKNVQALIKNAMQEEDEQKKEAALISIGRLMKTFYGAWNKENVDDSVIIENMQEIAGENIPLDPDEIKKNNWFNTNNPRSRSSGGGSGSGSGSAGSSSNNKRRNSNYNKRKRSNQ